MNNKHFVIILVKMVLLEEEKFGILLVGAGFGLTTTLIENDNFNFRDGKILGFEKRSAIGQQLNIAKNMVSCIVLSTSVFIISKYILKAVDHIV